MNTLVEIGLSNAVAAIVLTLPAIAVSWYSRRPALAHGLWLIVLLKLVTPPLWSIPLTWAPAEEHPASVVAAFPTVVNLIPDPSMHAITPPGPESTAPEDGGELPPVGNEPVVPVPSLPEPVETTPAPVHAAAMESRPVAEADDPLPGPLAGNPIPWQVGLVAFWTAGSCAWFLVAIRRIGRLRRLLRFARPASPELQEQARAIAARIGLRRCPQGWLVPGILSPMLWALLGRPRLLFPAELLKRLDADQLTTLLAHELAHLKRGDHWVRRLELLVTGLYWWHPVVWYARHELRQAEEQCCDAWVVWALPSGGRTYSTALLETVDFLSETPPALPVAASGIGHVPILQRRLTMIMQAKTPRRLSWLGLLGLAVLGMALLPWFPTLAAQEPPTGGESADERVAERDRLLKERQVDEARREVKLLAAEIEQAKTHLEAMMKRLQAAQDRLAALEGREAPAPRPGGASRGPGGGDRSPAAPPDSRPGRVSERELKNEVELLEAQVRGKAAQVAEAEARLKQADAKRRAAEQVLKRALPLGAAVAREQLLTNEAQLRQAESEVDIAKAQLDAAKAALQEAELRLVQAKQRLQDFAKPPVPGVPEPAPSPAAGGRAEIKVVALRNANAVELQKTLDKLFGSEVQILADPRTNSLILRGPEKDLMTVLALIERLDTPAKTDEQPGGRPRPGTPGSGEEPGAPGSEAAPPVPNQDRRLRELENKVNLLLQELLQMRTEQERDRLEKKPGATEEPGRSRP